MHLAPEFNFPFTANPTEENRKSLKGLQKMLREVAPDCDSKHKPEVPEDRVTEVQGKSPLDCESKEEDRIARRRRRLHGSGDLGVVALMFDQPVSQLLAPHLGAQPIQPVTCLCEIEVDNNNGLILEETN